MCETDKASFKKELMATQATLKYMSHPVKFSTGQDDFTINKDLIQYTADVAKIDMGPVSEADVTNNKANLATFTADVTESIKAAQSGMEAAHALKQKLIQ